MFPETTVIFLGLSTVLERTSQLAYLTQTSTSHDYSQIVTTTIIITHSSPT